ncbi:MAG: hypothetical protein ACI9RG_000526 [Sulfurimonas sp.]|jgi:uncharacterized protein YegP (UPF0339 family)
MSHNFSKGAFVLKKNPDVEQPYHFVLVGPNQNTLLLSENYVNSHGARNGIDSVRLNGDDESNYEGRVTTDDRFYFVLKAKNYEIIGRGMFHKTEQQRDLDIKDVMKHCRDAILVDETSEDEGGATTSEPNRNGSNRYA